MFEDLFSEIVWLLFSPPVSAALYFYILFSVSISFPFLFIPVSIAPSYSIINGAGQRNCKGDWEDLCQ